MNVVVLKFGGSSLSSDELREIAASRVLDVSRRGDRPVVVCSAIGRAPEPYATDTLAGLLGPVRSGPNRDLLLACGEAISCAVFAELLSSLGAPAQAMTGVQAGITTDDAYGDAEIVDVDPRPIRAVLARNVIPVVTGFQGGTRERATTTLGRGGSDLTAVALGDALGASSVEIYTDVSGVMTGDPRRVAGAHPLARVTQAEMVELAGNGAKVMHHKAAELAHATSTPYAVKGLRSGVGTTVDDTAPVDAERPVTGLTVIRDVTFCRIIQGLTDDLDRSDVDRDVLGRVAERGISIDMVNVNDAGVFFIVDDENADPVRPALADLNLALRMRPHCAKISIVGAGMRGASGVIYRVVKAVTDAGVEIIHSTDSNITISILVPADQADVAEQALHDAFRLGPGTVAR
ncbi:MAG: aspartate kinase [Candidatus Elarobacter sp.]